MKRRQIEQRWAQALERACPVPPGEKPRPAPQRMPAPRRAPTFRLALLAGACLLVLCAGFGYWQHFSIATIVDLDVNPAVELRLNRAGRVREAVAVNGDGAKLLGEMDLRGAEAEVAVNALLGAMLRRGILSREANSLLLSVSSADPERGRAMLSRLGAEAEAALDRELGEGAVLRQWVSADAELQTLSRQYGLTQGRAALMRALVSADAALTYPALSALSVNELALLSSTRPQSPDVETRGAVNEDAYIGRARAREIALAYAGVAETEAKGLEIEMELENGALLYGVEFFVGEVEHEYGIEAVSGKIVEWELEWKDAALAEGAN